MLADTYNYNQLCQLANGEYQHLFLWGMVAMFCLEAGGSFGPDVARRKMLMGKVNHVVVFTSL
jgi:hypothetical protein